MTDHDYTSNFSKRLKHLTSGQSQSEHITPEINIDLEYVDDISRLTTDPKIIELNKKNLTSRLKFQDLTINETKTKQYEIRRNGNAKWEN